MLNILSELLLGYFFHPFVCCNIIPGKAVTHALVTLCELKTLMYSICENVWCTKDFSWCKNWFLLLFTFYWFIQLIESFAIFFNVKQTFHNVSLKFCLSTARLKCRVAVWLKESRINYISSQVLSALAPWCEFTPRFIKKKKTCFCILKNLMLC